MDLMQRIRSALPLLLFLWGFLLGMPFYHIPTFTKGPLICALIGQERGIAEIFLKPHYWTYRPLLVLMFSTLYKLFGFHYEPYRIFAATFSGFFALFVYLFLLELHPSRKIAFFSTIIFTLTTPFLDGLWDLSEGGFYSTCLFYGAFLFFVKMGKCDENHKPENRYTFLFLLLSLLSLLIKETTRAMAPPLLFLYCYFMKANQKQWKLFWIFCGLSILTLLPMLSAPADPGSRAAVTTPFWEVAKISFQINVTQLMSVFYDVIWWPLLYYGFGIFIVMLATKKDPKLRFHTEIKRRHKIGLFALLAMPIIFLRTTPLTLFSKLPASITYFSAKYYPVSMFSPMGAHLFLLFFVLLLIVFSGNTLEKYFSVAIIFTFLSYFIEMILISTLRLEPTSRHYLLVLPFLCYFIGFIGISALEARKILRWEEKFILYPIAGGLAFSVFLYLFASAYNLSAEFRAIGKSEFAAWNFVRESELKDAAVFSPADGYALPQEYLKLAMPAEDKYVFFQLPRWFPSQSEFVSHLRHTIDNNHIQAAQKLFYYSRFYSGIPTQESLPKEYEPYAKIGYWYHVFAMHGVIASPLEKYLEKNTKIVYRTNHVFYTIPEYFKDAYVALSDVRKPFIQEHKYTAGIYIQNNEPKPK